MNRYLVCLTFALTLIACSDRQAPEIERQTIRPAKIMTIERQSGDFTNEFTARIEALQTIDVSFEVGGPLAELPIREGETIQKGALIAALDPIDFRLAVQEAEVQLKLASQDLNRKKKVLAENGIAKSVVEDAQSNFELQGVRLRQARERLRDTRIFAPFDAYVSQRYFDNHVNVKSGDSIVRLLNLTQLVVVTSIPERLLATVSADQLIRAWVEFGFTDQQFDLTYRENRGEADAIAQTYEVTWTMENPEQWNLLPGMTATAKFQLSGMQTENVMLPSSAIVPMADDTLAVWVYDPETQLVERRGITTAAPTQRGVPVIDGLNEGDQVVITGANQLQAGMKIRPL